MPFLTDFFSFDERADLIKKINTAFTNWILGNTVLSNEGMVLYPENSERNDLENIERCCKSVRVTWAALGKIEIRNI